MLEQLSYLMLAYMNEFIHYLFIYYLLFIDKNT